MERILELHQMEETLKNMVLTVFENWGHADGLSFIKESLLSLDGVTEIQKSNFIIATTTEPYDGAGTVFNRAIDNASYLYFLRKGEQSKFESYKSCEEFNELMEAIDYIKDQIH